MLTGEGGASSKAGVRVPLGYSMQTGCLLLPYNQSVGTCPEIVSGAVQGAAGAWPGLAWTCKLHQLFYTAESMWLQGTPEEQQRTGQCWPLMPAYAEAAFTVCIFLATARVFESFISAALLKAGERWKFIWVPRKEPRRKKGLVAAVMGGVPGDSAGGWEIKQLRNGFVGRTWGILSR